MLSEELYYKEYLGAGKNFEVEILVCRRKGSAGGQTLQEALVISGSKCHKSRWVSGQAWTQITGQPQPQVPTPERGFSGMGCALGMF